MAVEKAPEGMLGGVARQRTRSGSRLVKPPRLFVPQALMASGDYRFSDKKATKAQRAALKALYVRLVRTFVVDQWTEWHCPTEILVDAFSLGAGTVSALTNDAKRTKREHGELWSGFALSVLRGMAIGELAGPLGTPKNKTTRSIFNIVAKTGPGDARINIEGFGEDGQRTPNPEYDAFRALHVAFLLDYEKWRAR